MSESDFRGTFCKLAAPLDPVPIENLLTGETGVGMPDVEFIGGWAELKWKSEWPKRPRTPLRLDHYTQDQRDWLMRRWERGERTFLVLQIGQEWFFFSAPAAQRVGYLTRQELRDNATVYFAKKPTSDQVVAVLRGETNSL